jgi:hypothetical protein
LAGGFCYLTLLWATKKGCQQEKNVFHKSPYNNPSDFQNLKSLTQLDASPTQNYFKIGHPTYAPILRIPKKMTIFRKLKFLGETMQF